MEQLYTFNNDDIEWYTFKKDVREFLKHSKISKDKIIWCPFDDESSAFVKVLIEQDYKVIFSHIDKGQDFFNYEPKEYDLILSNPPFKGKAKIIERLVELNKPFALIFGIQCFNSGGFTRVLNKLKDLEMIFLTRRIKFHKGKEDPKVPQPTFHSMWICNKIIGKKISILEGDKYTSNKGGEI